MQASYPAVLAVTGTTLGTPAINGQSPNGWTVIFNNANPNNRVFVVCGP